MLRTPGFVHMIVRTPEHPACFGCWGSTWTSSWLGGNGGSSLLCCIVAGGLVSIWLTCSEEGNFETWEKGVCYLLKSGNWAFACTPEVCLGCFVLNSSIYGLRARMWIFSGYLWALKCHCPEQNDSPLVVPGEQCAQDGWTLNSLIKSWLFRL